MIKLNTPIRYPGGKSRSVRFILPFVPKFDEFREPFVGGASLFLRLKQKYPDKKFWINDLYHDLFTFWNELKLHPVELIDQINQWKCSYKNNESEMFKFLKDNLDRFDDIKIGASFYILNKISFSGLSTVGSFSKQAVVQNFTDNCINKLDDISKILESTKITNLDYSKVINELGENVFLFLDPPYYLKEKSNLYGRNGDLHKNFDHELFAETIKKCKHKWLITYNDCPEIRKLYDNENITIKPWNVQYSMHIHHNNISKQRSNELFIYNYKIHKSSLKNHLMVA